MDQFEFYKNNLWLPIDWKKVSTTEKSETWSIGEEIAGPDFDIEKLQKIINDFKKKFKPKYIIIKYEGIKLSLFSPQGEFFLQLLDKITEQEEKLNKRKRRNNDDEESNEAF